jgi:RecJ-like exonuclease
MAQKPEITTGTNDRPRNETIGQSGEGLPGSKPLEVDEAAARLRGKLQAKSAQFGEANADAAGIAGAGEHMCHRCAGTGMIDGRTCPECGGTGKTPIG